MNSDQAIIKSAYEAAIGGLYGQLFEAFTESGGDAEKQKQAEQDFSRVWG